MPRVLPGPAAIVTDGQRHMDAAYATAPAMHPRQEYDGYDGYDGYDREDTDPDDEYVDPNDVIENPPADPLKQSVHWGVAATALGYLALYLLFTNPEAAFGHMNAQFRDTYKASFVLAAVATLYILHTVYRTPKKAVQQRARYVLPVRLLLIGAALWVPLLYLVTQFGTGHWYSSVWYVVATRVLAASGAALLAFYLRDQLMENAFGTGALYYFLFHVILVDGMVWSYSYILGNESR